MRRPLRAIKSVRRSPTPGTKVGPAPAAPGTKVGPEIREHKGTGGGGPPPGAHGGSSTDGRRHRGPRHRRAPPRRRRPREPPHIRHPAARRRAPPPPREPPHIRHPRRAPPRRPPRPAAPAAKPSASRVNTAEFCRAGFPLRRERAASGVERLIRANRSCAADRRWAYGPTRVNCRSSVRWRAGKKLSSEISVNTISPAGVW